MAKKTSGKARRKTTRKAKEKYSYDVGHVPIKGELKLTPDRAREWLEYDYEGFQMLATAGLRHSKDEKDRAAFENFAYGVKTMVDACTEALSGESTVTVSSNLGCGPCGDGTYPFSWMFESLRLLRIPSLARDSLDGELWGDREIDAFDALVRIVEHYVYAAIKLEDKADEEIEPREKPRAESAQAETERDGSAEGESIDDTRLSAIAEVILLDEAKQPELMGDAGAVARVGEDCLIKVFYRPECTLVEFARVAEEAIRKANESSESVTPYAPKTVTAHA